MIKHLMPGTIILAILCIFLSLSNPVLAVTYERIDAPDFDISCLSRIAVLPFEPGLESELEGAMVADRLATHLAQEGYLGMVERLQIERIMGEAKFSREDFADPEVAAKFGKLLGADAVVIGRIGSAYREVEGFTYVVEKKSTLDLSTLLDVKTEETSKQEEKEQKKVRTLEKIGEVNIDTKVVDVETGKILASKVAYHNWKKRGVDEPEIDALPPRGDILEDCMANCMDVLIRAYTPHKVSITRELRPRSHATEKEMRAIHLAESGFLNESIDLFEEIIAKEPKKNDIRGNLAILYEAVGNFEKADFWLHDAVMHGKSTHDLNEYRNSMLNAWYFVNKKNLAERPIIVLDASSDKIYIDAGTIRNAKVGNLYRVCRETVITHPVTGEKMGSDKRPIAIIEIVEVQDRMSIAKIVKLFDDQVPILKMDIVTLETGGIEVPANPVS